jgi:hypothetical protein
MLAIRDGIQRVLQQSSQLSGQWATLDCSVDKGNFLVRPTKAPLRVPDCSVIEETCFEDLQA